ncbi:MAG: hypothetical protein A2622_06110 [Bdellovibrionales bacterium RIFCSPHIGHO2_01_FULL_40_29]|nr:MAG: hypothetical protein A2622_06110 [Bdellovibrionales bacterium RIFCSPHIGHO2_01_FULL_40_29]OFZ35023.1 MAG: hypothetical protein A3D17_06460 [Bdellovibrionales bacterium RIFCSPHIGHO2_02_FULL_40_15]
MKKNKTILSFLYANQNGQLAIEAVLLITVLLGVFLALSNVAQEKKLVQNLVSKPIQRVGRMAGYGTWNEECKGQGKSQALSLGKCHPNSIHRSLSSDPQ